MKQEAFCIETQTLAVTGQRVLQKAGLSVTLKRSNCGQGGSCAFELFVPSDQKETAAAALRSSGVPVLRRRAV